MPISGSILFVLYVADQARSTAFYESVFDVKPVLNVPGMTEFQIGQNTKLGIMPESGIAKIICPTVSHPKEAAGIPRCEIYLHVRSPEEYIDRAIGAGGVLVSELILRDWGDKAGYVVDPDGHILAFAFRPES